MIHRKPFSLNFDQTTGPGKREGLELWLLGLLLISSLFCQRSKEVVIVPPYG